MEKVVLKVPTIHCEGCVSGIRQVLENLPGIQAVEGNAKEKKVTVTLQDADVSRAQICQALAGIGHVCGE